ncbi:MAG: HAMP domain-containing histidine kinase [bacterium]|nr:HAMP domain-containing histidine kinase [bacterium]
MTAVVSPMRTRIGRHIALLFAGCALVPLVAFQIVATMSIRTQSELQTEDQLHGLARTSGMMIAARLDRIRGELRLAASVAEYQVETGESQAIDAVYPFLAEHARSLQLLTEGVPHVLFGDSVAIPLELTAADEQHLAGGKAVVRFGEGATAITMMAAVAPPAVDHLLVVVVDPTWFWTSVELSGPGCEFAACDRAGRVLFHTSATSPDPEPLLTRTLRRSSSGSLDWMLDGVHHVGRYWHLFVQPQYRADLLVIQSLPKAGAYAASDSFMRWAWLFAAATLLVAALASLVQIRRTLEPVFALRHAAERLGRGDLKSRARVSAKDELGELAGAFNEMASRLQVSIEQQQCTERELVESRDAALAAVRAKEAFLTNVSHELRTPMAKILSSAEILTQLGPDENEAREEFSMIALDGARDLNGMLDDVFALDNDEPVAAVAVEIHRLLETLLDQTADDLRARLQIDVPGELAPIACDCATLVAAIRRVLDNAVKFGPADTPIELRIVRSRRDVTIEVTDHGPGIAPADHERIFAPFVQVGRDQLVDKADGTGLGLALARRAAEACGGTLTVDSALGGGATFRFTLPAVIVEHAEVESR